MNIQTDIREYKYEYKYSLHTDAIGGWTKNTPKPIFFFKRKKLSKTQKLKNV